MNAADRRLLQQLLTEQRVLTLAVIAEAEPVAGLLPFATAADCGAVFVHASQLTRHSAGLQSGAPFSAVIHRPDSADVDPLQTPRFIFEGRVRALLHDAEDYPATREAYIAKFPQSAPIFNLPDFALYALQIESGRLVAGFARAVRVTPAALTGL